MLVLPARNPVPARFCVRDWLELFLGDVSRAPLQAFTNGKLGRRTYPDGREIPLLFAQGVVGEHYFRHIILWHGRVDAYGHSSVRPAAR